LGFIILLKLQEGRFFCQQIFSPGGETMAEIVNLMAYRSRELSRRAFDPWRKRFGESYDATIRLADLSDPTIYRLSIPGNESSQSFYELIMGVLRLGDATWFHDLDNPSKMRVVDIHLFLADRTRFEMMRRLGWILDYSGQALRLVDLILTYDQIKDPPTDAPQLAATHPGHADFIGLDHREKDVFIRRLLPQALELFKRRLPIRSS
jgi:hypothetical protein